MQNSSFQNKKGCSIALGSTFYYGLLVAVGGGVQKGSNGVGDFVGVSCGVGVIVGVLVGVGVIVNVGVGVEVGVGVKVGVGV